MNSQHHRHKQMDQSIYDMLNKYWATVKFNGLNNGLWAHFLGRCFFIYGLSVHIHMDWMFKGRLIQKIYMYYSKKKKILSVHVTINWSM